MLLSLSIEKDRGLIVVGNVWITCETNHFTLLAFKHNTLCTFSIHFSIIFSLYLTCAVFWGRPALYFLVNRTQHFIVHNTFFDRLLSFEPVESARNAGKYLTIVRIYFQSSFGQSLWCLGPFFTSLQQWDASKTCLWYTSANKHLKCLIIWSNTVYLRPYF